MDLHDRRHGEVDRAEGEYYRARPGYLWDVYL